ncbi:hypothetical protein METBIDRAFT_79224 [Metschnikowia bicuspidata var. bicuspidata NRRL YB-4993]|uniref:Uncharacterized protein n=1 Tax=Metschnikowia bicuspidata var. bicuspidata NRRL YB-4993 TaxID=869754 RepID=A0A1A0H7L8_9ASCO|nr:hypothetical protein METBIDRAFT_79224 [Metschnikowia bicuspidata var. bicuspidata NRRL YB-4993]OBA19887.1 hypothetical protein METBIDRAFT_79224 [Metschnikowia bicuspidata var. bicuspidata NRRL YB-4993]
MTSDKKRHPASKSQGRAVLKTSSLAESIANLSETLYLLSPPPPKPTKRQLVKLSSVILPDSGRKVYRTDLFFNSEFESFHDETINDSELLDSAPSVESSRSVLKCGVAYLLASLGVYYAPFSSLLGNTDSKHVAATASVYFHPARTKGSMHQLFLFVLLSLLFTFILSVCSRCVSSYFFNVGQNEVSYAIDLLTSSVGLGVIAFMKQKVNKETFNTACSLASISLVTCIVKEGSLNASTIPMDRLVSTSRVALVGSLISVATCYVLWPKSAVKLLRHSLNDSFNVMSSLVSVVTHRFINGDKISAKDLEVFALLRKHSNDLNLYLEEAKYELYLVGKEAEFEAYCEIVEATNSLMEHLHGLKSSCEMRWQLFLDSTSAENDDQDSIASLSSIHAQILPLSHSVENMGSPSLYNGRLQNSDMEDGAVYSVQLFDLFVYYLAPSIKSFAFTVKEVLSVVPFEKKLLGDREQSLFVKSTNYQLSLKRAIELYEEKQVNSFEKLYSQKIFKSDDFQSRTDQEEVTACCGNFSSLLALYGKQLIHFLQLTEKFEVVASTYPKSWEWARFWRSRGNGIAHSKTLFRDAQFVDALRELKSQLKVVEPKESTEHLDSFSWTECLDDFRLTLWKTFGLFKRTDVQFGLRVGVGAFCISLFAFLPQTQKAFVEYRLEWTLAIYCIMMNKSVGGTSVTAKWRFIGTFMGAFLAYLVWQVSDANEFVLAIVGFLLSLPCFYIIIFWKRNNAFGRFILLAYNLTALYSYSMLQKDSEDSNEGGDVPIVGQIAVHRFIAVSIGIVWALIFANFFLPNPARARLKSGLTILWLRMGVVWNSNPMDYQESENGKTLIGLKDFKGTRDLLLECQTLLKQAPVELRLKGRFPKEIYETLLRGTSAILDAFLNLQLMVEVDKDLQPTEEIVLKYVSSEREELEHRIFLIFYMVASAMALGFPLPTKPASTDHAKDRMLLKLSEFRSRKNFDRISLKNEDYVLLYSYILVTSTITKELDKIILNIKELLGDISEDIFMLV